MKILVFAPFFPPDPTGSSVFAGDQVAELVRMGHEVQVITNQPDRLAPKSEEAILDNDGGEDSSVLRLQSIRVNLGKITWNYGIPISFLGFLRRRTLNKLKAFNPDAVIVHSTLFDLSLLALLWARFKKKRVVIVSHTALWHDNSIVKSCMIVYGKFLLRPLIKLSKANLICVDKWTYDNALHFFGRSKKVSTIPVSVNLGTMVGGDGQQVRERHKLGDGPVVLSLGHVVPLRDRLNLTRSIPHLIDEFPDLKVVVVGMVKDSRFIELAKELGVLDHFVIVGAVAHEEIPNYLAVADLETHDLDGRGLGITSVEAMDAGVPIVAWAVDDNYPQFSLRGYGPSGFVDDGSPETIANKIRQILVDDNLRSAIKISQRKLVDEIYSCESVTKQYLEILETI